MSHITLDRDLRARTIAASGGLEAALSSDSLPESVTLSTSEAVVLGLLRQGVRKFVGIFGHGTTDLGDVLRTYEEHGLVTTYPVRNEVEAAHAAMALRWVTGEKAAVFTSIGPGAMQALAGSLAAASDGVGVWHIYADETTENEGPNMQQLPGPRQEQFLRLVSEVGPAYTLHTPEALPEALRRGLNTVDHPHRPQPFFLLLPINTQPALLTDFRLAQLPVGAPPPLGAAADEGRYAEVAARLLAADRVVVRMGGGSKECTDLVEELLELIDGFAIVSPVALGVLPYSHPRNMTIGGSKGTIAGNFTMENADLLLAIGSRAVCQADMSRTGYPNVTSVVNINAEVDAAMHYANTTAFVGSARPTVQLLINELKRLGATAQGLDSTWASANLAAWEQWEAAKQARYATPTLYDEVWGTEVLTQPAALKTATDWARERGIRMFFDAGDVQANGFQVNEDERLGLTFTETGASYMGFAASAILATGLADEPYFGLAFSGDGSFTMNPQVLIDGRQHGAQGCVLVFDNRRQGAISSLQRAQYGVDYATSDQVEVDYVAWANAVGGVRGIHAGTSTESLVAALEEAHAAGGLSLIHCPVYFGEHELGGLGAYGRWNVGSWVDDTQEMRKAMSI
jgi:3D-(3,5/4)-trihydroxycyclohexane-1,2-dione acylhydrolase (decyclizing)